MTLVLNFRLSPPRGRKLGSPKMWADWCVAGVASILDWVLARIGGLLKAEPSTPISIGRVEHHELNVLTMVGPGHDAAASDRLYHELDRAHVVPDELLCDEIVRMGSTVKYRTDLGTDHVATLVYPEQAGDLAGGVSILSPVGTALIGLRRGQSIAWTANGTRRRTLTVLSVSQPVPTESMVQGHQNDH
jgi:regulator of nucleoside diphosphate kinase